MRAKDHEFTPYILVDFDRTLAHYEDHDTHGSVLGAPVPAMLERVKRWLEDGVEVRIFTARAADTNPARDEDIRNIDLWCRTHLGGSLKITNAKDFGAMAIWDDLACAVEPNTGLWLGGSQDTDPLSNEEELRLIGYSISSIMEDL